MEIDAGGEDNAEDVRPRRSRQRGEDQKTAPVKLGGLETMVIQNIKSIECKEDMPGCHGFEEVRSGLGR